MMKIIGSRREPVVTRDATDEALATGARFSESLTALSKWTFIPQGGYRFKTHEAMNKHQEDCLARDMGLLAIERSRDRSDNPYALAAHGYQRATTDITNNEGQGRIGPVGHRARACNFSAASAEGQIQRREALTGGDAIL
jgi:hypothetical protein